MRIALIGPADPDKGGGPRHTTELAHRLTAAGHDVVLESWRAQYPVGSYPGGRHTVDVPEGKPFPRTLRKLSAHRPAGWVAAGRRLRDMDLVVFVLLIPPQAIPYLAILAGLRGIRPGRWRAAGPGPRTAVICHNVLPHERRPFDKNLTRLLLSQAGAALTHSAEEAVRARALAPGAQVITASLAPHLPIAPAPDGQASPARADSPVSCPPAAAPAPAAAPGALAAAGNDAGRDRASRSAPCRLLFFGMVRRYKGLDVLLHAVARTPGVVLTVAGEFWGPALRETRDLIGRLGIGGRVALRPGYVPADQIPALFATADVLVLPYRSATSSQNAWLAFAYGLPVVATRAGALADAVRDGVDGLICEPGDVDGLARALARVSMPGEAARLRAAIRPPDPGGHWDAYLEALLSLVPPPAREPPGLEPMAG